MRAQNPRRRWRSGLYTATGDRTDGHRLAIVAASHKELMNPWRVLPSFLAGNKQRTATSDLLGGRRSATTPRLRLIKSQIGEDKLLGNLREGMLKVSRCCGRGIDNPWERHWRDVGADEAPQAQALPQWSTSRCIRSPRTATGWIRRRGSVLPRGNPHRGKAAESEERSRQRGASEVARECASSIRCADGEQRSARCRDKIVLFIAQEPPGC